MTDKTRTAFLRELEAAFVRVLDNPEADSLLAAFVAGVGHFEVSVDRIAWVPRDDAHPRHGGYL